jgi:hypothetical protein
MFSIDLECPQAAKDLRIAELWEYGCTGIVELGDAPDAARMRAFFDDDALAPALQSRYGGEAQPRIRATGWPLRANICSRCKLDGESS